MAIDYAAIAAAGGIPKVAPRTLERHRKGVVADAKLEAAYAKVDERDRKVCQVRGTHLTAGAVSEWRALERHHLDEKSTNPRRKYDHDNILTTSRAVHLLLQASALTPIDTRGRETKRVSRIVGYTWNRRMVTAGKEPFRLLPRKDVA